MIDLSRRAGRPLLIGHRGAAASAPENTIAGFRTAVGFGVDLVELDLLALVAGPLVVAHSDRLEEITHGAAYGRVGDRSLAALRELAPALLTFDEALSWFAEEAPETGIHVDLKLHTRLDEVATTLERHGVAERTVVSASRADVLRAVARGSSHVRIGLTYPEDHLGVSRRRALWPVVRVGLAAMRASVPARLPRLLRGAGASALMLQHRLVSRAAVERAHALGAAVLAWTVDDPADGQRVVEAGVDGVITNDPALLAATLAT